MPIEDRSLTPGTILVARYRKAEHRCTVEQNEDGTLAFVLVDGSRHKSASGAGSAVMGGIACNGWRFWSLDGTLKLRAEKKAPVTTQAGEVAPKQAAKTKRPARLIKQHKSQDGVADGMTRYFCSSCMDAFDGPSGDLPAACPEGHSATLPA